MELKCSLTKSGSIIDNHEQTLQRRYGSHAYKRGTQANRSPARSSRGRETTRAAQHGAAAAQRPREPCLQARVQGLEGCDDPAHQGRCVKASTPGIMDTARS